MDAGVGGIDIDSPHRQLVVLRFVLLHLLFLLFVSRVGSVVTYTTVMTHFVAEMNSPWLTCQLDEHACVVSSAPTGHVAQGSSLSPLSAPVA